MAKEALSWGGEAWGSWLKSYLKSYGKRGENGVVVRPFKNPTPDINRNNLSRNRDLGDNSHRHMVSTSQSKVRRRLFFKL